MVSTVEQHNILHQDNIQKLVLHDEIKKDLLQIQDCKGNSSDKAENLQCVDEHSINYLVSSEVSNDTQSTSANIEADNIRLRIVELNKKGLGPVAIARLLGISRQRASRWIRRHEEKNGCIQVQSLFSDKSINTFPDSPLSRLKDNIEQDSDNSFFRFNSDDVEELQCIDEDSIEVLKSLYMTDDTSPDILKVVPHEDCIRDQIVVLHKEGLGPTAIARELGITRQRASRWVKRFISEGTIFTKQRIGRPKKLTIEQKYLIRKYIEEKPYATISEVMTVFNLDCSRSTVRTVMKASIWDDVA